MTADPLTTVEYTPHDAQEAFHTAPQSSRWFCGGYGSGKSKSLVIEALMNAVVHHPGFQGIVAAPTYGLLFRAWFQAWKEFVPQAWWQLKKDPYLGPHLLIQTAAHGQSTVWLRSTSDPASNEGINAAWIVFDEAPRERNRESYDVLHGRLRAGYPGRQRPVVIAGPPQTRSHWTAKEFGTGPDAGHFGTMQRWHSADHAVVRCRTEDNPFLPADYLPKLLARPGVTRAWIAQWLHALFGGVEGQVYESFSRDIHVVRAESLVGRAWKKVKVGTDWGYTKPGAMMAIGEDGLGDLYVFAEEYHAGKLVADEPGHWIPLGRTMVNVHAATDFYCDPSAPGHLQALRVGLRKGCTRPARVIAADNEMGEGIRRVAARLEAAADRARNPKAPPRPALYVSDACVNVINEFESWAHKKARDGSLTETPEDDHDHALDGVRYVAMSTRS
jgi:hypothetical protein